MTPPEPAEENLHRYLQDILSRPDLPAFSEHIQQILRCTADESSSVRSLTDLVLREVGVSLKVLRSANSPLNNRSGRPILSVSHATSLLGMQAIRDIAASMVLVEHFRDRSPALRELLVLSMLTANHAREFAAALEFPRAEEAYLCGMFRNLGEILIACYFPRDFAAILLERKQNSLSERHACRKVLHFGFEALGAALVEQWSLPPTVRQCQQGFTPGTVRISAASREFLPAVVDFSHQVTDVVYRGDEVNSRARLKALREAFSVPLGLSLAKSQQLMEAALREAAETSRNLRIPLDTLRLHKQMDIALAVHTAPDAAGSWTETNALEQLADRIEAPGWQLNDILVALLEEASRIGSMQHVLFGLLDPPTNTIHGRLGLGPRIDTLLEAFRFPLSPNGGPIALSILRRTDLFAFTPSHENRFERSAFVRILGAQQFALCPVIVDGSVIGCLYCDRAGGPALSAEVQNSIRRIRDLAAAAIQKSRLTATT